MESLRRLLTDPRIHAAILTLIASIITYLHPVTDQASAMALAGWILTIVTAWLFPSPVVQAQPKPPQVD